MFAKVGLVSVLMIMRAAVAGAVIGCEMPAPVADQPERAGSQRKAATPRASPAQPDSTPKDNASPNADHITIRGQVLDPDGKPVSSAQIVLGLPVSGTGDWWPPRQMVLAGRLGFPLTGPGDWALPRLLAKSGEDGRFEVKVPRETLAPSSPFVTGRPAIAVLAPRLAPDWAKLEPDAAGGEVTLILRLCRDDVPIEGRIIDLEGRPVPGLSVSIAYLMEFPAELLKRVRENAGDRNLGFSAQMSNALSLGKKGVCPPVITGADGRFRLTGAGRGRAVLLLIEGGSIEQSLAMAYTSTDPAYTPLRLPSNGLGERKLFGPRFDFIVVPGRVIEGVIRDRDTGRAIRGAKARSATFGTTISDDQGRFALPGQPKMPGNFVVVTAGAEPYFDAAKAIGDPPGFGPIRVDIGLERGVWVEGKVTNRMGGRPVQAVVQYHPTRDNPHVKKFPEGSFRQNRGLNLAESFPTDADGRFRAVALSGSGILTVRTVRPDFFTAQPVSLKDAGNVLPADFPYKLEHYQALVPINPANGEKVTVPDIVVVPRRVQHLKVVGPDGKPVVELRLSGNLARNRYGRGWIGPEYTFVHRDPGNAETILVVNQDETAGMLLVVKGDEPDPISITLQPVGTVTGRLVDANGRPRPDVRFSVSQDLKTIRFERFPAEPPTGPDGRFRISALVPGVSYSVKVVGNDAAKRLMGSMGKAQWTIKPGETQDWGDVQVKKYVP